jgi:hypothetical protein
MGCEELRLFLEILDIVLENEQVGLSLAGQPDERLIVILDRTYHFFTAGHLDADRCGPLDQQLEVFGLLEGLLGRAPWFSTWLYRINSPAGFSS